MANNISRDHLGSMTAGTLALVTFASALSFVVMSSGVLPASVSPAVGAIFHLLLFPVAAGLPAPGWVRATGYGWQVIDTTSAIVRLNGVNTIPLSLAAHVIGAVWVAMTSLESTGAHRIVGLLLALDMGVYSFIAPWVPASVLAPAYVLLPLWLVLTGLKFRAGAHQLAEMPQLARA